MSIRRFVLAAALVGCAVPLLAKRPDVALLAPGAGERLDGGREAALAWSAENLPKGAEEWEAFLSLDNGADYPVRVTPHLNTDIRVFRWHVPNVAASHVRLLLRFGDETDEHTVELTQTFTIVPRYGSLDLAALQISLSEETGEAAIVRGAPSVEWVSGDRDGEHLVRHRNRDAGVSGAPTVDREARSETEAAGARDTALRHERRAVYDNSSTAPAAPRVNAHGAVRQLLLLSTRLNV